jgi:conjugative relaxase-like TrwC/TraI family protein
LVRHFWGPPCRQICSTRVAFEGTRPPEVTLPWITAREVFAIPGQVMRVISIRRMSLGSGFRYLMESVAVGDGAPVGADGLMRYYSDSGTPPGVFLGAGLAGLNDGRGVEEGAAVSEEHLFQMLGMCADPVTGKSLGRAPNRGVQSLARRIRDRVAAIPPEATGADRSALIEKIEADEQARSGRLRPPVAGFDLTFSVSKSISSAWGLADPTTKAVIYDCHRQAIDIVLAYAEAEIFHSRSGTDGVVQEDVAGVVAAAFTHWDSRAADPQLHDHVVVLNRAQSVSDGKWRTLDSRGLFKAVVELSELHEGVISDLLTERIGWGWDGRTRRHSARLRWEVSGVPDNLLAEFSQRSSAIEDRKNALVAEFVAARGRQPTTTEVLEMRRRATLETRPAKTHRSLEGLTADWRQRALPWVGTETESWVASLADRNDLPVLCCDDLADEILADIATVALEKVSDTRATFSRANVSAEVHRQLRGVRFATPAERIAAAGRTVDLALRSALQLTPPLLQHTPEPFLRPDGTSRFRAKGHERYCTQAIVDAETRLLDAGRRHDGPRVGSGTVASALAGPLPARAERLSLDQAVAVERVATSGRFLDVLVGPAGTGKSMTMAGLRAVWEAEHGPGSVIGLAPSAAAAEVLADELGIDTENTAKWLTEHRRGPDRVAVIDRLHDQLVLSNFSATTNKAIRERFSSIEAQLKRWELRPGQLVIVDEASLAGTVVLDELVSAAGDAGAKVLLVGDSAQLTAVEAGSMFAELVRDRGFDAPELSEVRRFEAEWEKKASLLLRGGDDAAIDAYEAHGRITEGSKDELLDALYQSWKNDIDSGLSSVMIAPDLGTVAELNRRARADLVSTGDVTLDGVDVAGGGSAGVGDVVVTRQNDRRLMAGTHWVRNGDRWTVTEIGADAGLTVRGLKGGATVTLPAWYVREHVELGYAATAHRAQGRTTDTAHAMISPTTTREVLYVAATRGRRGNWIYVDTRYDPDPQTGHDGATPPQTMHEVLAGVLRNEGADIAVHQAIRLGQLQAESIATLAAEYQTIAARAQDQRWTTLLASSGLSDRQVAEIKDSPANGPLVAALREAESRGLDVDSAFPALVRGRTLVNADDVAAVLHSRVDSWLDRTRRQNTVTPELVAGLFPRVRGVTDAELKRGLIERDNAIESRAVTVAVQAIKDHDAWTSKLGRPPKDAARRVDWLSAAATVAAYRERWDIKSDPRPLGSPKNVKTMEQYGQHKRALAALQRAIDVSRDPRIDPFPVAVPMPQPGPEYGIEL